MDRIILDSTVVWVGTETDTYYSSQFQLLSRIFVNWDNSLYSWTLAFTTHVWSGRVLFCFFPCLFFVGYLTLLTGCTVEPMLTTYVLYPMKKCMSWRSFHALSRVALCSSNVVDFHYDKYMVGWSLTSLFSTNTAISKTKGQGWRVIIIISKGRLVIY